MEMKLPTTWQDILTWTLDIDIDSVGTSDAGTETFNLSDEGFAL